jgi:hypothetical protein
VTKLYECKVCKTTFIREPDLASHYAVNHPDFDPGQLVRVKEKDAVTQLFKDVWGKAAEAGGIDLGTIYNFKDVFKDDTHRLDDDLDEPIPQYNEDRDD